MPDPLEPTIIRPMSYKYHPWAIEMTDTEVPHWVSQKGAQLSVSEVLMNLAFHALDKRGISVLYGLPAQQPDARDFSTTRFNPALAHSPYLQAMFSGADTLSLKMAGQLSLYIRGSRGDASFKSIPVGMVLLDEVDAMDALAVARAKERMAGQMVDTFFREASTPTIPGEGVNLTFEKSTKDFFTFKCPHCSKRTHLVFPECLEITADTSEDPKVHDSFIKCKECKHRLEHKNKFEWLAGGKWIPANAGRTIRGFHISQLYSSSVSPGKLAISYLDSKNNPADEQEFFNSKLGLAHVVAGARLQPDEIHAVRAPYANGHVEPGVLTMGIDVGTFLHVVVVKYEFEPQIYDPNTNSKAKVLLFQKIKVTSPDFASHVKHLIHEYNPLHICIDAGPERASSEALVRQLPQRAHTVHYAETVDGKDISIQSADHKISVNRTYWLDMSLGRFKNNKVIVPSNIDLEFVEHMCAMTRHYTKDRFGTTVVRYSKGGTRTDYAHAFNYAEIALKMASEAGHLANIRVRT